MSHQIVTFFIVSLFLVISPGPNMALIIDNATKLGKRMHSLALRDYAQQHMRMGHFLY